MYPQNLVVFQRSVDGRAWYINGAFYPRNAANVERAWEEPVRFNYGHGDLFSLYDEDEGKEVSLLTLSDSPIVIQKRLVAWWQKNKQKYPLPVLKRIQQIILEQINAAGEQKLRGSLTRKERFGIQAGNTPHGPVVIGPSAKDLARLNELMGKDLLGFDEQDELEQLQDNIREQRTETEQERINALHNHLRMEQKKFIDRPRPDHLGEHAGRSNLGEPAYRRFYEDDYRATPEDVRQGIELWYPGAFTGENKDWKKLEITPEDLAEEQDVAYRARRRFAQMKSSIGKGTIIEGHMDRGGLDATKTHSVKVGEDSKIKLTLKYHPVRNYNDKHCSLHSIVYELTGYPYLGTPLAAFSSIMLNERHLHEFLGGSEGTTDEKYQAMSKFLQRPIYIWHKFWSSMLLHKVIASDEIIKINSRESNKPPYDQEVAPIHIYHTEWERHAEYLEVVGRDRVAVNRKVYSDTASTLLHYCQRRFHTGTPPVVLWYESAKAWFFLQAYVLSMASEKGVAWVKDQPLSFYFSSLDEAVKEEILTRVREIVEAMCTYLKESKVGPKQMQYLMIWNSRQFPWLGLFEPAERDGYLRRMARIFAVSDVPEGVPVLTTERGELMVGESNLVFFDHDQKTNLAQALGSAFVGKRLAPDNALITWIKTALLDKHEYSSEYVQSIVEEMNIEPMRRACRNAILGENKASLGYSVLDEPIEFAVFLHDERIPIPEIVYAQASRGYEPLTCLAPYLAVLSHRWVTSIRVFKEGDRGVLKSHFYVKHKKTTQYIDIVERCDGSYQVCVSYLKHPYRIADARAYSASDPLDYLDDYERDRERQQLLANIEQDKKKASS